MIQKNQIGSVYKFLTPLFISGFFFFLSFYFCMLGIKLFVYSLPFYALFLLISLFLFYRTDKKLNHLMKIGNQTINQYSFYHSCVGIYLILSFVLFGISVAYVPFYYNGGAIFVWYCAPMTLLCLISLIQSRKRLKWLKSIVTIEKHVNY